MANEMKNASALTLFAKGIVTGSFGGRLFGYLMFYILLVIFTSLLLIISDAASPSAGNISVFFGVFLIILVYISPALPFIFWERSVRKFRRGHGLSIYKNVREEMEQIEFNKIYEKERAMEERAREAYEAKKRG